MWQWITGFSKVVKEVTDEVAVVKAELIQAQELITEMSCGILTLQTEVALLKQFLAAAGVTIPTVLDKPIVPIVQMPKFDKTE